MRLVNRPKISVFVALG